MGVCTTLYVTRDAALTALARKTFGSLSDQELADKLNEHLAEGYNEPLDEVEINAACSDAQDEEHLTRLSRRWDR